MAKRHLFLVPVTSSMLLLGCANVPSQPPNAPVFSHSDPVSRQVSRIPQNQMAIRSFTIYFATDSHEVTIEEKQKLAHFSAQFARHQYAHLLIMGHTDSRETHEYNLQLARLRTNSVIVELLKLGYPKALIKSLAVGEVNPVASNTNAAGRKQNRRVEIKIL